MDVKKAAERFGISRRRVEALCADGRIPGAKKIKGKWQIPSSATKPVDERSVIVVPDDQISLFDVAAYDKKTTVGRAEVCRTLSVAPTTLKNWVRLGKIKSEDGGTNFDKKYVKSLARSMKKGAGPSRRGRAKKAAKTAFSGYVKDEKNLAATAALAEAFPSPSDAVLRALLAGCSMRLFRDSRGEAASDPLLAVPTPDESGDLHVLLGDLWNKPGSEEEARALTAGLTSDLHYVKGEDTLGYIYISLCDLSRRKQTGRYFTPAATVAELVSLVEEKSGTPSGDVLDPCCGTGNFLLALAAHGADACKLYGADLDEISVLLCRISLFLADNSQTYEGLKERVTVKNSLLSPTRRKYSMIVGNPPWGYAFSPAELARLSAKYASAKKSGAESFDLFIEMALSSLEAGGTLAFVVPESVLTVGSHEAVREKIIEKSSFSFVSYIGNVFSDVRCPAVILGLKGVPGGDTAGCEIVRGKERFTLGGKRPVTAASFALNVRDGDWETLRKIEKLPGARYLKGHAEFALGIVTGNNREFVFEGSGGEPVLRGTDVFKYRAKEPAARIKFEPELFQQCAPEAIYRAKEKLIYRFICEEPVFAYDGDGTLSLNSCNVLIPRIKGLGTKYILAVLNSSVASFFFKVKYGSVKMLRSSIESLPIPRADEKEQERIESLVDGILSGGDAAAAHREIDGIVADLYRLTEEEKKVVFESAKAGEKYLLK